LCGVCDDHIDFVLDEVGGQLREPRIVAIGRSPLDHHIASLDVARIAQSLAESLGFLARG
jgi:hypothetical protein